MHPPPPSERAMSTALAKPKTGKNGGVKSYTLFPSLKGSMCCLPYPHTLVSAHLGRDIQEGEGVSGSLAKEP